MRRTTIVAWCLFSCLKPGADAAIEDASTPAPVRGRTPFVFRTILEDKPRMCVVALHPELWVAYDPATCSLERAFAGAEFHGKVYDFSQQNTKAKPPLWFEQPNLLLRLSGDSLPADATANGVEAAGEFRFVADGAELITPEFDTARFTDVMVYFEERSRRAPFAVELFVAGEPEPRQVFRSTLHRDDDRAWQENAKRLSLTGGRARLRFAAPAKADEKALRALRVKGAYRAWSASVGGEEADVEPDWGGYVRSGPDGAGAVTLRYSLLLRDGTRVTVEERPEVVAVSADSAVLERRFVFRDLPPGLAPRLSLAGRSTALGWSVTGAAVLRGSQEGVTVEFHGDASLREEWGRPK